MLEFLCSLIVCIVSTTSLVTTGVCSQVPLPLPKGECYQRIVFGPGDILAAAYAADIHFINVTTGAVIDEIKGAHEHRVSDMAWSPSKLKSEAGMVYILATVGHDHRARLWKHPGM